MPSIFLESICMWVLRIDSNNDRYELYRYEACSLNPSWSIRNASNRTNHNYALLLIDSNTIESSLDHRCERHRFEVYCHDLIRSTRTVSIRIPFLTDANFIEVNHSLHTVIHPYLLHTNSDWPETWNVASLIPHHHLQPIPSWSKLGQILTISIAALFPSELQPWYPSFLVDLFGIPALTKMRDNICPLKHALW